MLRARFIATVYLDASFGVLRKTLYLVNPYNLMKYKTLKGYIWLSAEQT